jgi:N-acetylglucosaminyldiphosphoundecaprenol N-acetyl-beta-D-mannosaminyltransferase
MNTQTWPDKHTLMGVEVSNTTYEAAADCIMSAANANVSSVVTHLPVHGIVTGATDDTYRRAVNSFDIVAPDGMPVRWAMNRLHKLDLPDRCYGPELMLRLCARAAAEKTGVYLYGSTPDVIEQLRDKLVAMHPGLRIAGCESPPFRPLTGEEDAAVVERINASGAGLVFIGLGCPRQDLWAAEHKGKIHAVMLCVGAAFDFHAGTKKQAPGWMQRNSLEWFFRLTQEPRRLWKRYLVTNTLFTILLGRELLFGRRRATA